MNTTRVRNGLALALAGLAFASATAEVLQLFPNQFRRDKVPLHGESSTLAVIQNPMWIWVDDLPGPDRWFGWTRVNLPVGAVITGATYYHGGSSTGGKTTCYLNCVKFGESEFTMGYAGTNSAAALAIPLKLYATAGTFTIEPGYRYYVTVIAEVGTSIRGVKIFYNP